jgi:hypothetical protein
MSLSYRQEDQLRRVEAGVCRSDPHLAGMFGVFGRLYADDGMPAWEQVVQEPASRSRLRQAAAWSVTALIAVAAAISVLLSKAVAVATARRGCPRTGAGGRAGTYPVGREADAQQDADRHQKPWHPGRADGGLGRPDGPA